MEWKILVTDEKGVLDEEWGRQNGKQILSLSEVFPRLIHHTIDCKEILILAKKQETLELAKRLHIPAVGLEMEGMAALTGTPYILQGVEEKKESADFLEQVYRRYYELPVIRIETEHLFIREMIKSDTDKLYRLYHCADVQQEVDQGGLNREELLAFVESYRQGRYPFYDYGMWILEEKGTGAFVGEAGIEEDPYQDWIGGICLEAGYVICPEYRGKGYAAEALRGILDFVREKRDVYGFVQISCYIRTGNVASIRTAERSGFRYRMGGYGDGGDLGWYCLKL